MQEHSLVITVWLLDGRYHGVGDWPPSPFRLFQGLVAAAYAGRSPGDTELTALEWLGQEVDPPVIAAPKARRSRSVTYYVPNNDLDAVDGDPTRIAGIRTKKEVAAWIFDNRVPFLYVWTLNDGNQHAAAISALAERFYQLGRGVDMAYGAAEVLATDEVVRRLGDYSGTVHFPTPSGSGNELRCPNHGSLDSLMRRHSERLSRLTDNRLRQASPAIFRPVSYDSPPTWLLFDLIRNDSNGGFSAHPMEQVAALTEHIRNHVAARLKSYVSDALVERIIIGRNAGEAEKETRIRVTPLPSIGFIYADRKIRRILVEVPSACPIRTEDIAWAFSGLDLGVDDQTGEILGESDWLLVRSEDQQMFSHYGVNVDERERSRVWRTVTPVALTLGRLRGRISGQERAANETALVHAARQAIRHAGLGLNVEVRRVQREPFEGNGARAEAFAHGDRFPASRLHHLEIMFPKPIAGPVVIGDGRYLGLGLMAPVRMTSSDAQSGDKPT